MNKRNADKEKIDLMKWVNALKVHDPMHRVERIRVSASGKTIAIPDIPILLGCAFGSWGVVVGEVVAELLYK